jgi:integrase
VRKELSALRQFCDWSGIDVEIPGLPKHGHPGKRAKNARKPKAHILDPAQIEKVLAALPQQGLRRQGDTSTLPWVRDFFIVLWETGLRQSTLFALETPRHYKPGSSVLFISRDIDKAHDERELDLSLPAREALDRCVPAVGRIFPKFSPREPLAKACAVAEVPLISPYDIRHSRLTSWANTPGLPLAGVSYLAGHRSLATTAKYVQSQREAARLVVLGAQLGGLLGGVAQTSLPSGRRDSRKWQKQRGAKGGT